MSQLFENYNFQYIFINKDNEVMIDKNKFEKMIKDAYDEGYAKGFAAGKSNRYIYSTTITSSDTNTKLNNNFSEYAFVDDIKINNQSNKLYKEEK